MMNLVDLNVHKGSREHVDLFDGDDIIAEILAGYGEDEDDDDEDHSQAESHMLLSDQQVQLLTGEELYDTEKLFEHCFAITVQIEDRLTRLKYYLDELEHAL
jgi:hypothetical protein